MPHAHYQTTWGIVPMSGWKLVPGMRNPEVMCSPYKATTLTWGVSGRWGSVIIGHRGLPFLYTREQVTGRVRHIYSYQSVLK